MVDEKLEDQVWVTVVATGFGDPPRRRRREDRSRRASRAVEEPPARRAPPRFASPTASRG